MNNERHQFNKITKFITDSYNDLPKHGTIVVKSVRGGFSVNGIKIIQDKDSNDWQVLKDKTPIASFNQKRIAILFAALITKKRYYDSKKMVAYDRQFNILQEDKQWFVTRLKQKNNPILESRLSRTEDELNLLEQQLRELEKSLSLQ